MESKIDRQRYVVGELINKGSFGEVYDALDRLTETEVAIKIEKNDKEAELPFEALVYKKLSGKKGILHLIEFGYNTEVNYIVIEKGSESLEELLEKWKVISDIDLFKNISRGCLIALRSIHDAGFLHRDIKPENLVLKWEEYPNSADVYVIDFGLSSKYTDPINGHIAFRDGKRAFAGTPRYASINIHFGIEHSRRDDIESLCYTLIFLLKGKLPWQHIPISGGLDKYRYIREKKVNTSIEDLTKGLPSCVFELLRYCRSLDFATDPDYDFMIKLFAD